ncbi:hypothetical protein, partial [Klebsiella variicola]
LRMNMMISYQELVRTFLSDKSVWHHILSAASGKRAQAIFTSKKHYIHNLVFLVRRTVRLFPPYRRRSYFD